MMSEPIQVIIDIVSVLESLSIPYIISGSMASSMYGTPRATQDVDLVADIRPEQADSFVAALSSKYYVDEKHVISAITKRGSFNIIHMSTMLKVDIFIKKESLWSERQFTRSTLMSLESSDQKAEILFTSPEDIILNKMLWYKSGDCVSDKQRNDILGVIKIQGQNLDREYISYWAGKLDIQDIFEQFFPIRVE